MDTILDYIRWRGDLPLSHDGLRDADALVLSLLTYLDLKPIWEERPEPLRLRDCRKMIDEGTARILITGSGFHYEEIIAQAIASRRFGELVISDYVDQIREDPPLQFSAMCFHDESGLSFMGFRGTDDTLAGWKEDFMIGFTRTEAQELALRYADEHLRSGRRWFLGGHSKGANLALFAGCYLSDTVLEQVEGFYLLDGPGLCPEVTDVSNVERIDSRCRRIIPSFSVIGKLFEPAVSDTRIVRSTVSGILQHSLASWGIDHGELAVCEANNAVSRWISGAVREWIGNISQENRVVFIRELFDALSSGGARTVADLDKTGYLGREQILRRLLESSDVTRKIIADLPVQAVGQFISAASHFAGGKQRIAAGGPEAAPEEEAETAEQTKLPFLEDSPLPLRETADKETAL